MKKQHDNYKVVPFPKIRRGLAIMYSSVKRKPMVHGLMEVDVTKVRQYLREHKAKTGESLSFTAFIIRAANKKTFREIHHEIRVAQVEAVENAWQGLEDFKGLLFLPLVFFRFFWWALCWVRGTFPQVQKKYGGTVGVSAVGMFGRGTGWGIPINDHTLDITLGGIAEQPGVVDGQIAICEYLCMTLSMDHTIIDGAPAARFATRLKELIESGYGLCESEPV